MSHSDRHQFAPLTAKSKPFTGQRLSKVIAKAAKEALGEGWIKKDSGFYSPNLTESLCVSVPMIPASEVVPHIENLIPHIIGMLEDAQNGIIGELRKETGASEIANEAISIARCIEYMDAVSKGNRVTGEYLVQWFKDTYSLQAAEFIALACKFDSDAAAWTPDQVQVIETKSNVLASMFAGFASGKYNPEIPKCKAMVKFGEYLGADGMDSRMEGYVVKAAKCQKVREEELSTDALGF